jgi:hypothetical protein
MRTRGVEGQQILGYAVKLTPRQAVASVLSLFRSPAKMLPPPIFEIVDDLHTDVERPKVAASGQKGFSTIHTHGVQVGYTIATDPCADTGGKNIAADGA